MSFGVKSTDGTRGHEGQDCNYSSNCNYPVIEASARSTRRCYEETPTRSLSMGVWSRVVLFVAPCTVEYLLEAWMASDSLVDDLRHP